MSIPVEPPDGSVVRFHMGGQRGYWYVAVRRGKRWETTSSGGLELEPGEERLPGMWDIREIETWRHLAPQVRQFEVVTAWDSVGSRDPRVRKHLAVVRFSIAGHYLAGVFISHDHSGRGDWYTTISDENDEELPYADWQEWSAIKRHGQHIQVATGWATLS
ncbi:hypothetical protein [Mycobacterium sp. NPDC050041]|uniref:hypothetical protein n=1 Tax=Mycobacterium sp. NPDC050041 TaxID=3364293 RepID=UPI003C2F53B9